MIKVGSKIQAIRNYQDVKIGDVYEVLSVGKLCIITNEDMFGVVAMGILERIFKEMPERRKTEWSQWYYYNACKYGGTKWLAYRQNGETVEVKDGGIKASAKCSPHDKFDLSIGLNIATRRWEIKKKKQEVEEYIEKVYATINQEKK